MTFIVSAVTPGYRMSATNSIPMQYPQGGGVVAVLGGCVIDCLDPIDPSGSLCIATTA